MVTVPTAGSAAPAAVSLTTPATGASSAALAPTGRLLVARMWSADLAREHTFEPLTIEGTLPRSLRGTLYRNGPGQFGQFGTRYTHPFEADGAITAIRIADGRAHGACRIHTTAGLADERRAGQLLYGLAAPWHRRVRNLLRGRQKNTANTNVVAWQGRLFALMEAARPTELSPDDLRTIGETDLGGIVGGMFSAHPHRVDSRRAAYNFGLEYGRTTKIHLYELPDAGAARRLGSIELGGPPMLHDFIATDTHLVFFLSPVRVDVPRALLQLGTFEDLFRWRPELGTEILCVPIDRPSEHVRFTVDAFYQWHFANAFTRSPNELVVDYVRYRGFDSLRELGAIASARSSDRGQLHRATIDLRARTLRSEPLSDRACEFPTILPGSEGRETDRAFVVFDDLGSVGSIDCHGNISEHVLPSTERVTEPLFVDGHLLALCHTADRAFVAVYDASRIPDGPIARLHFDHHIPITFHGTYVPTV